MSRKLAVNTTVEGDTYPAGSTPPEDVAKKITNPKAWGETVTADDDVDEPEGYDAQGVEDLRAEADKRGLEVAGTGKGGNVVKADLVAALEADDAAGA